MIVFWCFCVVGISVGKIRLPAMDSRALYVPPMLKDGHAQAGSFMLVAEKEDQSAL